MRPSNLVKAASVGSLLSLDSDGPMSGESRGRAGSVKSTKSDNSQYNSDKHSMMEFAMHYFRYGRYVMVVLITENRILPPRVLNILNPVITYELVKLRVKGQ